MPEIEAIKADKRIYDWLKGYPAMEQFCISHLKEKPAENAAGKMCGANIFGNRAEKTAQ